MAQCHLSLGRGARLCIPHPCWLWQVTIKPMNGIAKDWSLLKGEGWGEGAVPHLRCPKPRDLATVLFGAEMESEYTPSRRWPLILLLSQDQLWERREQTRRGLSPHLKPAPSSLGLSFLEFSSCSYRAARFQSPYGESGRLRAQLGKLGCVSQITALNSPSPGTELGSFAKLLRRHFVSRPLSSWGSRQ